MGNKVLFVISQSAGGGAEHIMKQLANYVFDLGNEVKFCITNQKRESASTEELNSSIPVICLPDSSPFKRKQSIINSLSSAFCSICEQVGFTPFSVIVEKSFLNLYEAHIGAMKEVIRTHKGWKIVVFLQPANQIVLYAAAKIHAQNSIYISERSEPQRMLKSRYGNFFVKRYYGQVEKFVFQTPDAMAAYPDDIQRRGYVIVNPISNVMVKRHQGPRQKKIVNFCRLSPSKNLTLLIDAFDLFVVNHPDYMLEIIGNGELEKKLKEYCTIKSSSSKISLLPHRSNVAASVADYAMYVSSSDYEGMSNSMLEAMAYGIPTICTDCPIGGARYVIKDGINGLLVPPNDTVALATAMARIADDENLSLRLSIEGEKIKEAQSPKSIFNQWKKLLEI